MNSPDVLNLAARLAPEVYRQIEADLEDLREQKRKAEALDAQRFLRGIKPLGITVASEAEMISAVVGFDVSEMPRQEQIGPYLGHRLFVIANAAAREFGRAAEARATPARRRIGEAE